MKKKEKEEVSDLAYSQTLIAVNKQFSYVNVQK
jgi:hypothetical protein